MRRFLAQTAAPAAPASRSRSTVAVLGGIAVATLASGCMVFNPVQTDVPYEPAGRRSPLGARVSTHRGRLSRHDGTTE